MFRPTTPLLALSLLLAAGCTRPAPEAPPPTTRAVRAAVAVEIAAAEPVRVPAVLGWREEPTLSFTTGGVVGSVEVRSGDSVRAGDVLASLDTQELDARVSQSLRALERAERDLVRAESLQLTEAVSEERTQNARTAVEIASEELRIARFHQRHARVVAPGDGVVLARLVEPGEIVAAGTPIVRFAEARSARVARGAVPAAQAAILSPGDRAHVHVGTDSIPATLVEVPSATALGQVVPVTLTLESDSRLFRSGAPAAVEIAPSAPDTATLVPAESIVEADRGAAFVWLVPAGGGDAERLAVSVLNVGPSGARIRADIPPGRLVVTSGAELVRPGERLVVQD